MDEDKRNETVNDEVGYEEENYASNDSNTQKGGFEDTDRSISEEENIGREETSASDEEKDSAFDTREDSLELREENDIISASYVWDSEGARGSLEETEHGGAQTAKEVERVKEKSDKGFLLWLIPVVAFTAFIMGIAGGLIADGFFEGDATPDIVDVTKVTMNKNEAPVEVDVVVDDISRKTLTVSEVADLVSDAVVEVKTSSVVRDSFFGNYVVSGAGSGVVITQTEEFAYIVTNFHVIDGASDVVVTTTDGSEYEAEYLDGDATLDIAMIRIKSDKEFPTIVCGSSSAMRVGQGVVAIGNPLGELGGTVTNGIISALDRRIEVDGTEMVLMQTNAAVNPGNSGGGLFNMAGELIGIVNAKESATGVEGLGFAIPIDRVYDVLVEIIEDKYIRGRPTLDIEVNYVSSTWEAVKKYGIQNTGIFVTRSGNSEIEVDDYIVSINNELVYDGTSYAAAISDLEVGATVTVELYRSSQDGRWYKHTVEVTVEEYVPTGIFG